MIENIITSVQNNKIKQLRSLKQKSERDSLNMFVAEGDKVIIDAINAGLDCIDIFIQDTKTSKFTDIINLARQNNIPVVMVNDKVMAAITQTKTPQGAAASFYKKEDAFSLGDLEKFRFIVMLEQISDPGNLGTIIRTCDAVGVDMVILEGCTDIYNNKVIRSSMGSIFNLPCVEAPINPIVERMKASSWQVGCGHLKGGNFYNRLQNEKVALIIGNESAGIKDETAIMCTDLWKLPMRGKADSLNASIAAGIMLYDISNRLNTD